MADKWAENNPKTPPALSDDQACAGFVPGGPCGTADDAGLPMTSGYLNAAFCWMQEKFTALLAERVPDCPRNGGPYVLGCSANGDPSWVPRPPVVVARKNAGGEIIALVIDGVTCPIASGGGGTGGGGTDPVCPPASDFTISADRTTATYNGTETNVQMCYRDNFGNSGVGGSASRGICFPIAPGQTVSLSHDSYDPFVLGSMEVVTGGVSYAGTPPDVPGARPVRASETPPGFSFFVSDGTCPSITLLSTQSGFDSPFEARSTGVFSYA